MIRLVRDLRAEGVKVILGARDLPPNIAARFRYPDHADDPTELRIDVSPGHQRAMLLNLAHEAGHYRGWKAGGDHGEAEAKQLGLVELRRIGFEPAPGEWDWWHDESLPVPYPWEEVPPDEGKEGTP